MDDETDERPATAAPAAKPRARRASAGKRRAPKRAKRAKPVRWSARREDRFLTELAQTSNVAASFRAAGLSETSVYRRRQKSDEFRARWAAALREGFAKLKTMLLERALNGVEKVVWHGGRQVGTCREYSDRLALALLSAHRGAVMGVATAAEPAMTDDEIRAHWLERMSEMNLRMGGEG